MQIRFPGVTCAVCGQPLPPGSEAEVHPTLRGPKGGKKYYHSQHGAQGNPKVRTRRWVHKMSDDEFDRKYEPLNSPSVDWEYPYWEADEIVGQKDNHVWTVLHGDVDRLYIVPGIHRVNQFAFMVTRKPWKDKNIEVKWT